MKNKSLENYILSLMQKSLSDAYIVAAAWSKRCENTSILEIESFIKSNKK